MDEKTKQFLKLSLFEGIAPSDAEKLLREIPWRERRFPRGSTILHQEDLYAELTIILEGESYAEMIDLSGKVIRIEEFNPPFIYAPAVLFSTHQFMPGSVLARTDCRVITLSRNSLLDLCVKDQRVLENLLRLISERFVFLSHRLSFLSFKTIREKVLHYLFSLKKNNSPRVRLPLSMEDLAGFFGVTRPALSRVFMELEEDGIIRKNRREVEILGLPEGLS